MENKVRFGLSNVHYALWDDEKGTYETPVAIKGAVNLDLDPQGDSASVFADNIPYATFDVNNGYKGSMEILDAPDEFLTSALGYVKDKNGAVSELADSKAKSFALLFEVNGDATERRFALFNVGASRPKISAKTKGEKIETSNVNFDMVVAVRELGGKNYVKTHVDSGQPAYDKFMDKVYIPGTELAA